MWISKAEWVSLNAKVQLLLDRVPKKESKKKHYLVSSGTYHDVIEATHFMYYSWGVVFYVNNEEVAVFDKITRIKLDAS